MKFLRLGDPGAEQPAVLAAGPDGTEHAYSLLGLTRDIDGAFLAHDGAARVRAALAAGELPALDPAGLRIGAPVARPRSVVAIGLNYADHAAEAGAEVPTVPVVFLKPTSTVAAGKYDWEAELAIVVGRDAHVLPSAAAAAECIAGYACANDLSERDWQMGAAGQWTKGKSSPGSTPLGPWLVPADETDPADLRVRSWVNGEPRQDSRTADLVFSPAELVHHVSQYMLLEAGDVILTGTPAGVALSGRFPYLAPGDTVEVEVEGLGRQRCVLTAEHAAITAGAR
jgi:2-keto-4-pentenoate hydratase/2-oxohepta-3-ene-1,7-dioic acid hydratase in catechol pathway